MGCTRELALIASLLLLLPASGCIVPEDMPALREELGFASVDDADLVVKVRASTQTPVVDEPVELSAEIERLPASAVELTWDVNGSTYETATLEVTFASPGEHPVRLEVVGPNGTRAVDEITIEAHPNQPPQPELHIEDGRELWSDEPVVVRADGSTDPDGDELAYAWRLDDETVEAGAVLETELAPGPHHVEVTVTDGYAEVTREQAFAVDQRIHHEAEVSLTEPETQVSLPVADALEQATLDLTHTTQAGLDRVNLTLLSPEGETIASTGTEPGPGASQASERLVLDGGQLPAGAHTLVVSLEQGTGATATIEGVFTYSPLPSAPG